MWSIVSTTVAAITCINQRSIPPSAYNCTIAILKRLASAAGNEYWKHASMHLQAYESSDYKQELNLAVGDASQNHNISTCVQRCQACQHNPSCTTDTHSCSWSRLRTTAVQVRTGITKAVRPHLWDACAKDASRPDSCCVRPS